MKPYLSTFRLRALLELQYRAAAIGGLVTQVFFGGILVMLYHALYASGGQQSTSITQLTTYVWIQQGFFRLLYDADGALGEAIMSGNVAYELCRPVNLYGFWYARNLSAKLVATVMRATPVLFVASLIPGPYGLSAPSSVGALLAFIATLMVGMLCVGMVDAILNGITMKTLDSRGVSSIIMLIGQLLAGNIIPLTLFPDRWQGWLRLTPYAQLMDAPIRLYTGIMPLSSLPSVLAVQLLWTVALMLLGIWIWQKNAQRLVVQGG